MSIGSTNHLRHVLVLGAGSFGTCLANHLSGQGHRVTLWARDREIAQKINSIHRNPRYFPDLELCSSLKAEHELNPKIFKDIEFVVLAIPTQALRSGLELFRNYIQPQHRLICAAKGIEVGTLALPIQIIADVLGKAKSKQTCFISGPSFASEIIRGLPTAVCIASENQNDALIAQELFHAPTFRTYTCDDPIGLEVAGALKNVIAIAAGICSGLNFGQNASASLITRGLAEIMKIGLALGAKPLTFVGLSGVGDLFLTCSSTQSRNFQVGALLGSGKSMDDILKSMNTVAEGIATTKAAHQLLQKLNIKSPMIEEVYGVIYNHKPIRQAVEDLLNRDASAEFSLLDQTTR